MAWTSRRLRAVRPLPTVRRPIHASVAAPSRPAAATTEVTEPGEAIRLTLPRRPSASTETAYTPWSWVQATIPVPSGPSAAAGALDTARSTTAGREKAPPAERRTIAIPPPRLR
jgi:hypothetical protein